VLQGLRVAYVFLLLEAYYEATLRRGHRSRLGTPASQLREQTNAIDGSSRLC
jgi:hypothetical protein